eukprot:CAMPEP_0184693228 /NCGR_PEP_ID=MMETSP0313-20130426/1496_1 /TAXON_ID=2792 /ORGANISM="Porphyridium aerugineum, Strain SAG 1380-2" /LENGTH=575 /DNA_ID=CAMNT_0027151245 /DNA_START=223 /DNA_END=1950 /DNA_ORIENTATION=-
MQRSAFAQLYKSNSIKTNNQQTKQEQINKKLKPCNHLQPLNRATSTMGQQGFQEDFQGEFQGEFQGNVQADSNQTGIQDMLNIPSLANFPDFGSVSYLPNPQVTQQSQDQIRENGVWHVFIAPEQSDLEISNLLQDTPSLDYDGNIKEFDTDECDTHECDTHECDTEEFDTEEFDTHECDTDEFVSDEFVSDEFDSDQIDSDQIDSDEIIADEFDRNMSCIMAEDTNSTDVQADPSHFDAPLSGQQQNEVPPGDQQRVDAPWVAQQQFHEPQTILLLFYMLQAILQQALLQQSCAPTAGAQQFHQLLAAMPQDNAPPAAAHQGTASRPEARPFNLADTYGPGAYLANPPPAQPEKREITNPKDTVSQDIKPQLAISKTKASRPKVSKKKEPKVALQYVVDTEFEKRCLQNQDYRVLLDELDVIEELLAEPPGRYSKNMVATFEEMKLIAEAKVSSWKCAARDKVLKPQIRDWLDDVHFEVDNILSASDTVMNTLGASVDSLSDTDFLKQRIWDTFNGNKSEAFIDDIVRMLRAANVRQRSRTLHLQRSIVKDLRGKKNKRKNNNNGAGGSGSPSK